jgi:hypothetical protein
MVFICIVSYVPLTLSPHLQESFGSLFAGALMATMMFAYRTAKIDIGNRLILDLCLLFATVYSMEKVPISPYQTGMSSSTYSVQQAEEVVDHFAATMARDSDDAALGPSVFFTSSPIPYFNFGIRYFEKTGKLMGSMVQPSTGDKEVLNSLLSSSNYVVLSACAFKSGLREIVCNAARQFVLQQTGLIEIERQPFEGSDYVLYATHVK